MKRVLTFVCIVAVMAGLLAACGSGDVTINVNVKPGKLADGFEWDDYYSEIIITGYSGDSNDLKVPDTINGKPVTIIAKKAFKNFTSLVSIALPKELKTIGEEAFCGCTSLTEITIPESVTKIEAYAFGECDNLKKINWNAIHCENDYEIFSKYQAIGPDASIVIGDKVESLGEPFQYVGMTQIVIPDSVKSIGDCCFWGCDKLESIHIGAGCTSVGDIYRLAGTLKTVTVSNGNPAYCVINNCLIEKNSKKIILGLPDCKIPTDGSVTSIGDHAFYNNKVLTEFIIPEGVTSIGDNAFYSCTNLSVLTVPKTLTDAGYKPFDYCLALKTVYYSGTKNEWNNNRMKTVLFGGYYGIGSGEPIINTVHCSDGVIDLSWY